MYAVIYNSHWKWFNTLESALQFRSMHADAVCVIEQKKDNYDGTYDTEYIDVFTWKTLYYKCDLMF